MRKMLSIDIGSTYTKGALFDQVDGELVLSARCCRKTTTDCLANGFREVAAELLALPHDFSGDELRARTEIRYSSSAKGGLNVAVSGIVPELTMRMAKETACSAGARIGKVFSYKLTSDDLETIAKDRSDIVLLAGGTDGGAEAMVLNNAAMLKKLEPCPPVIYAGNRVLRETVARIFNGRECILTENILPTLDKLNPEPARACIRELFLKNIVVGKGLDTVVELTGAEPVPTPYAMLEFVKQLAACGSGEFCVIDIGGATTDVYSSVADAAENDQVVSRGLPEPPVKRTVEGDVGMRLTATSAVAAAGDYWKRRLADNGGDEAGFQRYLALLANSPEHLPSTCEEEVFERILAACCIRVALMRHAGRQDTVYTVAGPREVRTGRDLRGVKMVVGTGGYLAEAGSGICCEAMAGIDIEEPGALLPEPGNVAFVADREYLLPLLANIGFGHSPFSSIGRNGARQNIFGKVEKILEPFRECYLPNPGSMRYERIKRHPRSKAD